MMPGLLPEAVIAKADQFLDSEPQIRNAEDLGKRIFEAFRADQSGRVSSQVRNLQQCVISATRFSDIEYFVKNQMGRATTAGAPWQDIGEPLLRQLQILRQRAEDIAGESGEHVKHMLRLYLARGWIKSVVGAYMYAKALREMGS